MSDPLPTTQHCPVLLDTSVPPQYLISDLPFVALPYKQWSAFHMASEHARTPAQDVLTEDTTFCLLGLRQ